MADYDSQAGRAVPPDAVSGAQAHSDDDDVRSALDGLAGLVSDVNDLTTVLTQIAEFTVEAIPGADGAGVTLVRTAEASPNVVTWAATHPFVREIDHLQYEVCREGPCLTAMRTQRPLISGSLGSDKRWPRFGGRVARLAVHSALSLPLISRGQVVGALNVYARERDTFTEHALRLAEQFGDAAAVAVGNIQLLNATHERATQLQVALTNRAIIDQAIGIVRSRSGATADDAFERLRRVSQTQHVKLATVAQQLVDEAVRRARERRAPSPGDADRADQDTDRG